VYSVALADGDFRSPVVIYYYKILYYLRLMKCNCAVIVGIIIIALSLVVFKPFPLKKEKYINTEARNAEIGTCKKMEDMCTDSCSPNNPVLHTSGNCKERCHSDYQGCISVAHEKRTIPNRHYTQMKDLNKWVQPSNPTFDENKNKSWSL